MCSALHKSALVVGRVIGVCIPNTLCLIVNRPAANFLKVPATPIEGGDDRARRILFEDRHGQKTRRGAHQRSS